MVKTGRTLRAKALAVTAVVALMATSGCVERLTRHGYVPSEEMLATVELGRDTRESVVEKLGRPTMGGLIEDGGLYYITYNMVDYGPFAPKETDRVVVAVTFDGSGIVRNIETFGLERGQVVSLSRRVTDDGVRDNTLLRQILGSIGRVNAADLLRSSE